MLKKLVLIGLVSIMLSGCSLLPGGRKKQGALQVTSNSAFSLYLDDNFLGQVPFFDERIAVGEYTLRLVPSGGDETEGIWQTKIRIGERSLSVVHYESAEDPAYATSEVLELEPLSNKEAIELTISSLPDNVVVKLDGELKGFSPIVFDAVSVGDHVVSLEAPGYKPKTINVKTNAGHRLRVSASLARDPELELAPPPIENDPNSSESGGLSLEDNGAVESEVSSENEGPKAGDVVDGVTLGSSSAGGVEKPYVQILETGVGWLRVRSEPAGLGQNEVAKVQVGNFYGYVSTSDNEEWTEIEYLAGKTGWVSAQYVSVVE